MSNIINIIIPVFALIAVGYSAAFSGLLKSDTGDALASFVYIIAIPVFLMKTMATADFSAASPFALWGAYFSGVAVIWLLARQTIFFLRGRQHRTAVIAGVASGFSNLVLTGIPVIHLAYGNEGIAILILLVTVHMPVMMSASTLLMEHGVRADGADKSPFNLVALLKNIIKNLLGNPIIVGIFAGLLWRVSTLPFSGIIANLADTIGTTAGPLALFSVGMSLNKYGIKANLLQAALLASLSLLVLPTMVYLFAAKVFVLPALWIKVATLAAALPTGVNAYLFASQFNVAQGLATNTIILTIIGSVFTLSFWLWLLG